MSIEFDGVPTSELIDTFNACQEMLGGKKVVKFENREAAERRTRFALSQITDESKRPGRFAGDGGASGLPSAVDVPEDPEPALEPVSEALDVALDGDHIPEPEDEDPEASAKIGAAFVAKKTAKPKKPKSHIQRAAKVLDEIIKAEEANQPAGEPEESFMPFSTASLNGYLNLRAERRMRGTIRRTVPGLHPREIRKLAKEIVHGR